MENLEIKYKIIEISPEKHSMVVRFFTDEFDEDKLATSFTLDVNGNQIINRREDGSPIRCETDTSITIWKTPTPNISELQILASSYAPRDWFRVKMAVANANIDTSLSELQSITNQVYIASLPPEPEVIQVSPSLSESDVKELSEEDIQTLINELSKVVANT